MHRNIRLLGYHQFFTDFSFYGAILIIYFQRVTGSYASAMSLYGVTMISSAVFELPTGIYSDYIGRKRTIIVGSFCAICANLLYAVGINYWILFAGALFEGAQRSWYSGNNDALLYESLAQNKKDKYETYLGKVRSMAQFASAIAILIGSIFATQTLSLVMWVSVIPPVACLIIATKIIEPKTSIMREDAILSHLGRSISLLWRNRKLRLLSISSMISFAIGESTFQFRSAFVASIWPLWAVGFVKIFSNLSAGISFWFSGWIIRKLGPFKLMLIANIYSKVIDLIATSVVSVLSPALLATTSIFYGSTQIAKSKVMQEEFTDAQRATLGSVNSFFGNIVFGIVAVFIGYCGDVFGPRIALLIAYIVSLPNIWVNWHLFHHHERKV